MFPQQEQPQQPDPHGYVARGAQMANRYTMRQYWGMKWVTLVVVGLAMLYTVNTGKALLPLGILPWFLWICGWWWGTKTLRGLAANWLKADATGNTEIVGKINNAIPVMGWFMWFIQTVGWYWVAIIAWLSFFVEIPPQ